MQTRCAGTSVGHNERSPHPSVRIQVHIEFIQVRIAVKQDGKQEESTPCVGVPLKGMHKLV